MSGTLHVIGAGLAGLACAVAAARAGWHVHVHEATSHAGGRCRSFHCTTLDRMVDNGSHLLLGANRFALSFAAAIGGDETLTRLPACFPFLDIGTGKAWTVTPSRLNAGLWESARALGFPWCRENQTVATRLGQSRSFASLWEPLCEAMLNTPAAEASASMLAAVLRAVLLGGPSACRPLLAASGLSALFAAPAEATLASQGAAMTFHHRLTGIGQRHLEFDTEVVPLDGDDRAVLAVPPWAAAAFLPEIPSLPVQGIINVHFRLDSPPRLPGGLPFLALSGGMAQWLFVRDDIVSVTVSAANRLMDHPTEHLIRRLWQDMAVALKADPTRPPPARVVKEKRATLTHSPSALSRRPGPATKHDWLWLAGDWLASPWPCTMESAVASGLRAARLALGQDGLSFA